MLVRVLFGLGGLALVAGAGALAYFAGALEETEASPPPPAPLVDTVRPARVSSPPAIVETGFVRAAEEVEIVTEISGRVVEIGENFELGAQLEEGALLVQLDDDLIETDLAQARADLNQARAAQAQASAELTRQEELAESEFASEADLERATADAADARSRVEQAEAAIRAVELRLEDTRLNAPFDALVTAEAASVGQLLQVGTPIGTLVAADVAEVRTGLTEADFRRLREAGGPIGRDVRIEREGGGDLQGEIAALAPVLDGVARTVEIVVEVEDPFAEGRALVLNSIVTLVIPLPESDRDLFRLPSGALQVGERLWRVLPDGTLEAVEFSIQERGEEDIFVTSDDLRLEDRILLTQVANPLPGLEVRTRDGEGDGAEDNGGDDGPAGDGT